MAYRIGYPEYQARYGQWINTDSARKTFLDVSAKVCRDLRAAGVVPADKGGNLPPDQIKQLCDCNAEGSAFAINMTEGKSLATGTVLPSLERKWEAVLQGCLVKVRGQ
jgi:hypothetical protein